MLLNLTNPKAPATANAVPKFPFTKNITTCTNTGKTVNVNKKFGVVFVVILWVKLITTPNIIDTNMQIKQLPKLIETCVPSLKTLSNIIYFLLKLHI